MKFIIIGQGVAGSLLAWDLINKGHSVFVIDQGHEHGASQISAGVINPIKGKRFSFVENFEQYFTCAKTTYKTIEDDLNISFFQEIPITRVFSNPQELKKWTNKRALTNLSWVIDNPPGTLGPAILNPLGSITIHKAGLCHTQTFLNNFRRWLSERNSILEESFNYADVIISDTEINYKNIMADHIIFCEGYHSAQNPWFNWLPYNFAKGEVLTIRPKTKDHRLKTNEIIKGKKWIIPQSDNTWSLGTTYHWDNFDNIPTNKAKEEILEMMKQTFQFNFEILDHQASVRPILEDQQPVLGTHPLHNNIHILNGLASKGWLLAPTFAPMLADFIIDNKPIVDFANITRFNYPN